MPIQGNDWWYVGGAAAGGAIVGVLGSSLFKGASEPVFTGFAREYRKGDGRVLIEIWAAPDGEAYFARIADSNVELTGDLAVAFYTWLDPEMLWRDPSHVAEETDGIFMKYGWTPVGQWGFHTARKLLAPEPVAPRISGPKRKRR